MSQSKGNPALPNLANPAPGLASHLQGVGSDKNPSDKVQEGDKKIKSSIQAPATSAKRGGGSHGSIDQQFKVNPVTGTMSLGIPIHTTPARSDLGPGLTLSYDSGSGNGPFGIGWQLSTTAISRKTSKGIPEYGDGDVFTLSGYEDLVPETDALKQGKVKETIIGGYRVNSWRPRIEQSCQVIESWEDISSPNNVFWKTISGDNVTTIYGESDKSRIFESFPDTEEKHIYSWLACRSYDSFGNAMEIHYKEENSEGINLDLPSESTRPKSVRTRARYVKSIKYGNREPNRDLENWKPKSKIDDSEWMFEVIFDYGEHDENLPTAEEKHHWQARAHPFSVCNSGFEVRYHRLCRRVLMFHRFPHPKELKRDYCLVSSSHFEYRTQDGMELLQSFVSKGHLPLDDNGYKSQSLPPFRFQYTEAKAPSEFLLEDMKNSVLHNFNYASEDVRWVDLFGDGAPGILHTARDGAWTYQRNQMMSPERDSHFSTPQILTMRPSEGAASSSAGLYFEDINRDGNMDVVLVDQDGRLAGYYEYETAQVTWSNFTNFNGIPNFNMSDHSIKKIDLNGDGFADIVKQTATGDVFWYKNLAKVGFAPGAQLPSSEARSHLYSNDQEVLTTFADMTGDGLADLVEVANGRITYWSNLGNGNFGPGISMGDCPLFASDHAFNIRRLHLTDINGSGTTDVVYLPETGGLHIYYNQAGNSLGPRMEVACFSIIDNLSSVFTMDLMGNGTSCLCWLGPQAQKDEQNTLYYIDLTGGQKPFLLRKFSSSLGSTTNITYKPSTSFSLADEMAGRPWSTKLSFPVQCVFEVLLEDEIAKSSKKTRYAYRDGYYDGFEREFRGFGSVETWEQDEYAIGTPVYFKSVPLRRKTWYYVGSPDYRIEGNYRSDVMLDNLFPPMQGGNAESIRDIHRALKGSLAREEVFADDDSARASVPYTTVANSYEVRELQAKSEGTQNAVYRVISREIVNQSYERCKMEPKRTRSITLEADDFGNPLKVLSIQEGANSSRDILPPDIKDQEKQQITWATYTESRFTSYMHDQSEGYFYQPALAKTQVNNIANLNMDAKVFKDKFNINYTKEVIAFLENIEIVPANEVIVLKSTKPQKALVNESRVYFYDREMTKRFDLGEIDPYSTIFQSYELVFTKDLLQKTYSTKYILRDRSLDEIMKMGGYVQLEGEKGIWWAPSDRLIYSQDEDHNNLLSARQSFYTPNIMEDSFKATTVTKLDRYYYLVESVTDPLGNTLSYTNDYIQVQPFRTTDLNGNRTDTVYDCFGSVAGVARIGKATESSNTSIDSTEGFEPIISEEALDDFIRNPSMELCRELLGKLGSRTIKHPHYAERSKAKAPGGPLLPYFVVLITSDQYGMHRDSGAQIKVEIIYHDGQGNPLQTASLDATGLDNSKPRWLITDHTIQAAENTALRQYFPRFANSHDFKLHFSADSIKSTSFMDPLGRIIGNLHADRTWDKIVHLPWSKTVLNSCYTLEVGDPSQDLDIGAFFSRLPKDHYLPTWLQEYHGTPQEAAVVAKSLSYKTTPPVAHTDARGHVIVETANPSLSRTLSVRRDYDITGNLTTQLDQRSRVISNATFDMRQNQLHMKTMDTGDTFTFNDYKGQVLLASNSRGILFRYEYDKLGRLTNIFGFDTESVGGKEILLCRKEYGEGQVDDARLNLCGQLYRIRDQSGIRTYEEFDAHGNCLRETFQLAVEYRTVQNLAEEQPVHDIKYHSQRRFDALDRMTELENARNELISTEYHLNGLPRTISFRFDPESGDENIIVKNVSYRPDGNKDQIEFGNKTTVSYTYHPRTQLLLRKMIYRVGEVLQDLNFTYDSLSRVISKTDKAQSTEYFRNQKVRPIWDYTFNPLGQLIQTIGRARVNVHGDNGSQLMPHTAHSAFPVKKSNGQELCQYLETYTYDDAGNLTSMQQEPLHDIGVTGWTRTFAYKHPSFIDPGVYNNSLSSSKIGNDEEFYNVGKTGCMTTMPNYSSLEWDWHDKLRSSSKQIVKGDKIPETTYYVYNSDGARVRKVTERSSSTTGRTGVEMRLKDTIMVMGVSYYTTFQGNSIAKNVEKVTSEVELQGHVVYLSESNLSSLTCLARFIPDQQLELDDFGRVVHYEEFSAFGSTTYTASQSDIEADRKYRFASYERDTETGLYFCQARYLAPWLGRWISPDPLLYQDGLHLYAYVQNDPVNFHDPTGTVKKKFKSDKIDYTPDSSVIDSDIEGFGDDFDYDPPSERKGDQHHLFMSKYSVLFRELDIDSEAQTFHVEPKLNNPRFRHSHDAHWDKFWKSTLDDAHDWYTSGKGKRNRQIVDLDNEISDLQKNKGNKNTNKNYKTINQKLIIEKQMEKVAVYMRATFTKADYEQYRQDAFDVVISNLRRDHLVLEDIKEHLGPKMKRSDDVEEPMFTFDNYKYYRQENKEIHEDFTTKKEMKDYYKSLRIDSYSWFLDNTML